VDKESVEFGEALLKVRKEFHALTGGTGKDLTVEETVELQKYILARCNFSKSEEQMTNEEGAWKVVYDAAATLLEKTIGVQAWKDLEQTLLKYIRLSQFQEVSPRMFNLIPRIEELFIKQYNRLGFHGNTEENDYRIQENRLSTLMLDKALTDKAHSEHAQAIIELVEHYKQRFLLPFTALNEDLHNEILRFEFMFNSLPVKSDAEFDKLTGTASSTIFASLQRWLDLSKELFTARMLAADVINRQVELDLVVPTLILENHGNIATGMPAEEGKKFKSELEACAEQMRKSVADNDRIQAEREPLGKQILNETTSGESGRPEEQPVPAVEHMAQALHPLEGKTWFRLLKVVFVGLAVVGFAVSVLIGVIGDDLSAFLFSGVVVAALLVLAVKVFYYVVLGRTTAYEKPGKGFLDLDDIRKDFARVQAEGPELYREVIQPYLDSWKVQYGRRVPFQAYDQLRQRIRTEVHAAKAKRDKIVADVAAKGQKLDIADLRARVEKDKAEYRGADKEAYVRSIDNFLLKLETKYGTSIPIDEATRLMDELEDNIRNEDARGTPD
jgi:hypothetical protein